MAGWSSAPRPTSTSKPRPRPSWSNFDADIDSADLPLANYLNFGQGVPFDAAMTALRELAAGPLLAAVVLTEVNPTRDPGGELTARYVDGVTAALS